MGTPQSTPIPRPVIELSATELAAQVQAGELTSRALVDAHIAQIETINPPINAMVRDRFAEARTEADAADQALRDQPNESLPPFHGVPCSIKECFALTGMPNAAGLVARRDVVAQEDATAVARYRNAGAIPLGVTNTSELCMWVESNNYLYGRTNNPYNHGHTAGGSSGGDAALVGAGGAPFGLGSDIGGSIRLPAFFNGIFGHKPTGGMVPGSGQFPNAENQALRYLCTGPLTRRAKDLMPLLRILAGPDGHDTGCQEFKLGNPDTVELENIKVINIEGIEKLPVHPELQAAQAKVVAACKRRGMKVETISIKALNRGFDIWSAMMSEAADTPFRSMLGEDRLFGPAIELCKWAISRSDHTAMASLLALTESLTPKIPFYYSRMCALGRNLKQQLIDRIGDDGIMLFPSFPVPAPPHDWIFKEQLRLRFPYTYTAILNAMELPATQVPLGLSQDKLPLGIQVAALHGNDHITIAVAQWLEDEFGGWIPPPLANVAA